MKWNSLLLIVVIVALVVAAVRLPHSGAYFSDVQTATVTIRTGVWSTEADSLVVDKGNASFVGSQFGPHTRLHGIRLSNSGESPITIDRLIVCWSPEEGYIRVVNYWDWGDIEWSGEEPSGAVLDLTDAVIMPGKGRLLDLTFDTAMGGVAIGIEFIMADGSSLEEWLLGHIPARP